MFVLLSSTGHTAARMFHSPIYIYSDAELASSDAMVSGDGTEANPYVISGWEVYGFTGPGISIQGTTSYLIIRDVHVNSTSDGELNPAIYLYDVSNVRIEESLLNSTCNGVVVSDSDNVTISNVDIVSYTGWGVDVSYSEDISVMDSYFMGSNGIQCVEASEVVASSNHMDWVEMGIVLNGADNSTVQDNDFWDCGTALSLTTVSTSRITGNSANNSDWGIVMCWVFHCNVSGNVFHEMEATGMWSYGGSHNNTIFSNVISNCSATGMIAVSTVDCTVTYNTFRNNSDDFWAVSGGVWLQDCSRMLLHHNGFYDNVPVHAYDEGTGNRWNDSYPVGGNYWDDYAGPDDNQGPSQETSGSDGIGDYPYEFDVDNRDEYPLVDALNTNTRPSATFTVTPDKADTGEEFSVDATGCSDEQDSADDLRVRWDWDGDGTWDTTFSTDKTTTHVFLLPGNYTIRMEVLDTGGLSNITSEAVEVTGTAIPEFTSLVVPVFAVAALFLVMRRRR